MKPSFRYLAVVAAFAAVFALGACSNSPNSPGNQISRGAQEMGHGIVGYSSDTAITSKVKARMGANTGLNSFDVHVSTENGIVTLTGTVDSEATRETAGHVARTTGGVKGVNNKLKVGSGDDE
ncbi:MAG: BON domain-containing protein [Gammaproteobacteria bacterium]